VEASKKLLAEAGYKDGFEMGMDCPNDRYVNDEKICQAVVGMLARAGIKVNLLAQTRTKYFEKILARNTAFSLLGWQPLSYDAHSTLQETTYTPVGKSGTYERRQLLQSQDRRIDERDRNRGRFRQAAGVDLGRCPLKRPTSRTFPCIRRRWPGACARAWRSPRSRMTCLS
jgi:ABC-type transport system substrate-binding protein